MNIPRRRLLVVLPVLVGAVVWAGLAGTRAWAGCATGCVDKSNCGNLDFTTCSINMCTEVNRICQDLGCCQVDTRQFRLKKFFDCDGDHTADCEVWLCLFQYCPFCAGGNPACF